MVLLRTPQARFATKTCFVMRCSQDVGLVPVRRSWVAPDPPTALIKVDGPFAAAVDRDHALSYLMPRSSAGVSMPPLTGAGARHGRWRDRAL